MDTQETLDAIARRAERILQASDALGLVELEQLAHEILILIRDHGAAEAAKWIV